MLKEVNPSDITDIKNNRDTPLSIFCRETVAEFVESGLAHAEVTGFPTGYDYMNRYQALRRQVKRLGNKNLRVTMAGGKLFLEMLNEAPNGRE